MATAKMYECETKRRFRGEAGDDWRWVVRPVKDIEKGAPMRCAHCAGEVRLYRRKTETGTADHVQHVSQDDAKHCKAAGAKGDEDEHRMSAKPVA